MKSIKYKRWVRGFVALVLLGAGAFSLSAQNFSFFRSGKERQRSGDVPTVITADSMDIDIAKDVAVFSGNVVVDDEQMNLSCDKMYIHLKSSAKGGEADVEDEADINTGGKQVSRIVCIGNVVIIRKLYDKDEEGREQKALAGRADYDVQTGQIMLTEEPVLMRADDSLRGEKITIWRDSEKMKIEGASRLELGSDSMSGDEEETAKP